MQITDSLEKTLNLGKIEGVERDNRGSDGSMASRTQWTWAWVSSESWWWTRKPVLLQSMGLQRVWSNWVTELNWLTSLMMYCQNSPFMCIYIWSLLCDFISFFGRSLLLCYLNIRMGLWFVLAKEMKAEVTVCQFWAKTLTVIWQFQQVPGVDHFDFIPGYRYYIAELWKNPVDPGHFKQKCE